MDKIEVFMCALCIHQGEMFKGTAFCANCNTCWSCLQRVKWGCKHCGNSLFEPFPIPLGELTGDKEDSNSIG